MENNKNPEIPEEVKLTDTIPPDPKGAHTPASKNPASDLPEITIRENKPDSLEKTFNLTTTLNTEVMRQQYQKSFHNPQDPQPQHHTTQPEIAPTIRLKRRKTPTVPPTVPPGPQAPVPSAESTTFRLRRKTTPANPKSPVPPAANPAPATPPQPEMAPAPKTVF